MKQKSNRQHYEFSFQLLLLLCIYIIQDVSSTFLPCARRAFKTGIVCVCNETYCDTLEFEYPKESGEVFILSTTKNGLRYDQSKVSFGGDRQRLRDATNQTSFLSAFSFKQEIYINRNTTFQKIIGFGNAFTGAVLHNLNSVPTLKENIYKSHFSKTSGNGLNMMRIPIGGCDFDLEPWAYNELPENDFKLSNFTQLDPRDLERITEIKNLMNVADVSDLKFVGAAWSSPKWMKTNNAWTGFSALKSEYYQTYADYHVKYLELMHESGIDYWAVSTGNEPLNGVSAFLFIKFMSLGWLPNSQGKWVSDNLGPSLKNHQVLSTVKILTGDDQRYTLPIWFDQMYANHPKSKDFVDGHAVHWYWDKLVNANVLDETHQKYPDKLMLVTEACSGDKPWEVHGPVLGYWPRCEDYILDIIENLSHNVQAWIDWNMILDETGGPNYVSNFVDAPIIVNTTSGVEFYKQPIYYALGHFSRFLIPDSVRLDLTSSSRYIFSTAFLRPDGFVAVILYNSANNDLDVDINDSLNGVLRLTVPAKSVHTLLYK